MRTALLVSLLVCLLSLAGCSKNKIVGTWNGSDQAMPAGASASFEFKADGTFSTKISAQGMNVTAKGTYTYESDTLTLTPQTMEASGGAIADMIKEGFDKGEKKPQSGKVEFKSDDEFTWTTETGASTLKRAGSG